jgi:hypothetical protein
MSGSAYRPDISDVFRVIQYQKGAWLNYSGYGLLDASSSSTCSTYCPLGAVDMTSGGDHTPFTVLAGVPPYVTRQRNLEAYGLHPFVDEGQIHATVAYPQAIRTPAYDAYGVSFGAALATGGSNLTLSLFETKASGCP